MDILNINQEEKRRVAIYIRVSTAEQKISGYGLDAQKNKLVEYINNNKALGLYTQPEWFFEDTHTGSDLNRKGYEKMMQAVKDGKFDAVLVWKIDRLSRSLKHLLSTFETFEKNKVSFISVQENIDFKGPIGKLIFQIFGAIAQFERELIKGRTSMGKIASAEMGNYTGNAIPYGYKPITNPSGRGKKLQHISEEKKMVEDIYNWYIYEDMGDLQITNKLNDMQVPRGKYSRIKKVGNRPWSEKVVSNILTNSIYRGEFVANRKDENGIFLPEDKWTIVKIPECVSEFTFQQAQAVRKSKKAGHAEHDYMLSGKLRDISIEPTKGFVGAKRTKGGYSYRRKQFKDKQGIHHPVFEIPTKQIDEYVWNKIVDAVKNPEVFIKNYLAREYADTNKKEKLENQLNNLREAKINIDIATARVEQAYENGSYSEDKMSDKLSAKNDELANIETQIQDIEAEIAILSSFDIETQKLKNASKQVKYKIDHLNDKQKKILCNLFVDHINMYRERKDNGKWLIQAEVHFRFNPDKFANMDIGGRTQKELHKAEKASNNDTKSLNGATGRI